MCLLLLKNECGCSERRQPHSFFHIYLMPAGKTEWLLRRRSFHRRSGRDEVPSSDEKRLTGEECLILAPAPGKHAVTGVPGQNHDFLYPAFLSSSQIFREMKFQAITNTVAAILATK